MPENAWKISANEVTIAAKLDINALYENTTYEVSSIARIQYYWLENINGSSSRSWSEAEVNRTFIPAVRCKDLYSHLVDPDSSDYNSNVAYEFDKSWICPNVTSLELYGDPFYMQYT